MRGVLLVGSADPLRRVAGLSLLERNVRTLQHAGVEQIWLSGSQPELLRERITAQGVAPLEICAPAELGERLDDADDVLLLSASTVHDKALAALLAEAPQKGPVVLWDEQQRPFGVRVTAARLRALDPGALGGPKELAEGVQSGADPVQIHAPAAFIVEPVADHASAARAADLLWESCRKPVDGLISRNLNRHVSLFLSRRLVDTAVHPNHVSIVCLLLGVLAGVLTLQGGYWWILAGATVFKINSILDGVDGELARVKWAQSKLGELLDSAGDNLANFSYFGSLAWVTWQAGHSFFAALAAIGLGLWSLYLIFLYTRLYRLGRGDVLLVTAERTQEEGLSSLLIRFGRQVLRRDSFVMLAFLAALAGVPHWVLPIMALGSASVFGYMVAHLLGAVRKAFAPPPRPSRDEAPPRCS